MTTKTSKRRGRPALDPSDRKSRNLTFRSRGDLRARLDQAASQSERSISEEIEYRLERSFTDQSLMFEAMRLTYGPELAGLLLLIGAAMKTTGPRAGFHSTGSYEAAQHWWNDPYAFGQVAQGVHALILAFKPPGNVTLPAYAKKPGKLQGLDRVAVAEHLGENDAFRMTRLLISKDQAEVTIERARAFLGDLVNRLKKPPGTGADL